MNCPSRLVHTWVRGWLRTRPLHWHRRSRLRLSWSTKFTWNLYQSSLMILPQLPPRIQLNMVRFRKKWHWSDPDEPWSSLALWLICPCSRRSTKKNVICIWIASGTQWHKVNYIVDAGLGGSELAITTEFINGDLRCNQLVRGTVHLCANALQFNIITDDFNVEYCLEDKMVISQSGEIFVWSGIPLFGRKHCWDWGQWCGQTRQFCSAASIWSCMTLRQCVQCYCPQSVWLSADSVAQCLELYPNWLLNQWCVWEREANDNE